METNELLVVIEQSITSLRTELVEHLAQIDGRFESVDRRFDKVDERFDKVDERFDELKQDFNDLGVVFEGFEGKVQLLAEIVDNNNEKLDRHREETARGFEDLRREIRANCDPLRLRIEALEERCP